MLGLPTSRAVTNSSCCGSPPPVTAEQSAGARGRRRQLRLPARARVTLAFAVAPGARFTCDGSTVAAIASQPSLSRVNATSAAGPWHCLRSLHICCCARRDGLAAHGSIERDGGSANHANSFNLISPPFASAKVPASRSSDMKARNALRPFSKSKVDQGSVTRCQPSPWTVISTRLCER